MDFKTGERVVFRSMGSLLESATILRKEGKKYVIEIDGYISRKGRFIPISREDRLITTSTGGSMRRYNKGGK